MLSNFVAEVPFPPHGSWFDWALGVFGAPTPMRVSYSLHCINWLPALRALELPRANFIDFVM